MIVHTADDQPKPRRRRDLAALISSALNFTWVTSVGWLVSRPASYYERYGTTPEGVGHVSQQQLMLVGALAAVVVGVATWWLSVPRRADRPVRQSSELLAWMLSPLFLLAWHVYGRWPVAFPDSERIIRWDRDAELWFASAVGLGALSSALVALTLVRRRRLGDGIILAIVGLGWILAGSGIGRPREITESVPIVGAHVPGPCAQLYGGLHVAPALLVAGLAVSSAGLALSRAGARRDAPGPVAALIVNVALVGVGMGIAAAAIGAPTQWLATSPCIIE